MKRKNQSFKKLARLARRCSKQGRKRLIQNAPNKFIQSLVGKAKRLTRPGAKLSAKKRRQLTPYKHDLESLSRCTNTQQARNKLLQRGGFLLPFLAIKGRSLLKGAAIRGANKVLRGANKLLSFISRNR